MSRTISLATLAFVAMTPSLVSAAPTVARDASVLSSPHRISTIGSTIDPLNGDQNPYGLTIAPKGGNIIAAGDLVACNFNDKQNIQGLGTSIVVLKPVVGAKPRHLIADPTLTGCAAIAMGGSAPWVAALDANDNPIVSSSGGIITPINNYPWTGPWGQAFVNGPASPPAFYESNANDGSIVRINLGGAAFTFDKIVAGLPVNHGVPGAILAPSGLTYDAARDVLYVVDGAVNEIYTIANPATIPNGGIRLKPGQVGGAFKNRLRLFYRGAPLAAPISAALLYNGDLIVGNTANNQLIELRPNGQLVATTTVDGGVPGAIFGIVASGTSAQSTKIYFNDDNDNTIKVLTP